MLDRILNRNKEPTVSDEPYHNVKMPPRLPGEPVPPRQPEYRAPALRRDPEVEAMMVSANTLLSLREQVATLQSEVEHLRVERETWKARAEAKQELLTSTHEEMLRYKSFCDAFTARFGDVSVLLVKLIEDAQSAAQSFQSSDSVRQGSQAESLLNESHLTENTNDQH